MNMQKAIGSFPRSYIACLHYSKKNGNSSLHKENPLPAPISSKTFEANC